MSWMKINNLAKLKNRVWSVVLLAIVSTMFAASRGGAQALQKGISVELARTSSAVPVPEADNQSALIVTVTENGKIYLGINPIADDSLAEKLKGSPARTQNLYVKADARSPYASVVRVLDIAHAARVANVTLLTTQLKATQAGAAVLPQGIEMELAQRTSGSTK